MEHWTYTISKDTGEKHLIDVNIWDMAGQGTSFSSTLYAYHSNNREVLHGPSD
jgi:hypothetical protein